MRYESVLVEAATVCTWLLRCAGRVVDRWMYSRTAGQVGFIAQRGSEVKGWAGGAASHSRGIGIIPALASLLTHWMSALM